MSILEISKFITPDGVEFNFDSKWKALLTEEGLGMPEITYITQRGPFQHGETVIDYRLSPRVIQLLYRSNGKSRDDYWRNRSTLIDMLRPNRSSLGTTPGGVLRKIFQDGTVRDISVVSAGGPIFSARSLDRWDEWGFTETLRFIAYDPTFFDPDQKTITWASLIETSFAGFITFPITFPIEFGSIISNKLATVTYTGTWLSYPTIVITGPLENLIIENETTGETIRLLYDISPGEVVTMDLSYGRKTVTSSNGANLIGSVSLDSDFVTFHIAPAPEVAGGVNTFRVRSSSITEDSRVELRYYERFIGL